MSRATEITLFLILVQAAMGFVDATNMFSIQSFDVPKNNASYVITDLETYSAQANTESSMWDDIYIYAKWAVDSFLIGLQIVLTVVFVLPMLVTKFNIEPLLAVFIQVGIYYVYSVWYVQYKSGKPWKMYE